MEDASAGETGLLDSDYNHISFHRGYYIRARAVGHCVQDFLLKTQSRPRTQVRFLCLGVLAVSTLRVKSRFGILALR